MPWPKGDYEHFIAYSAEMSPRKALQYLFGMRPRLLIEAEIRGVQPKVRIVLDPPELPCLYVPPPKNLNTMTLPLRIRLKILQEYKCGYADPINFTYPRRYLQSYSSASLIL